MIMANVNHITLRPDAVIYPPVGVIVGLRDIAAALTKARFAPGLYLGRYDDQIVVFHPTQDSPDLPWFQGGARYLRRLAPNVFCPMGYCLTLPDWMMADFKARLASDHGLSGAVMIEPGDPLGMIDLAHAMPVDRVDLPALAGLAPA
jgi:hypothetical protein